MKAAAAIAEILKREGVELLFAYPRNAVIEAAAAADIRPIIVRQERIAVHMAHDVLTLSVFNTIAPQKAEGEEGIGLYNVRERLAVQFEGRAGLVAGGAGGEWRSEITMPAIHHSPVRETRHAATLVDA